MIISSNHLVVFLKIFILENFEKFSPVIFALKCLKNFSVVAIL